MSNRISEQEVEKIAFLSRLSLTAEEKRAYAQQLSSILDYFEQLSEINTDGMEPLVTPTEIAPYWRADEVKLWHEGNGRAEAALEQSPERLGNLFKVPPVVGG